MTHDDIFELYEREGRVTNDGLVGATLDDLLELHSMIARDSALVNDQILGAKAKLATTGKHSDSDWYRKALLAKKFKGQLMQRIQNAISSKKRQFGEARKDDRREKFIEEQQRTIERLTRERDEAREKLRVQKELRHGLYGA